MNTAISLPALPYDRAYPVLGRRLRVRTHDPRLADLAERAFGHWHRLDPGLVSALRPAILDLMVGPGRGGADNDAPQHTWADGHFITRGKGIDADSDLVESHCVARLTESCLEDGERLIHHVLEAHALQMLTQNGREPVHAAAVARNGRALVLAGESMVGKSTLCYAMIRLGWQLIADDVVFVEAAEHRVWGHATTIRLLPDAARFFPELAGIAPRRLPNGKVKRDAPVRSPALTGTPAWLVVVGRGDPAAPALLPMSADSALEAMYARPAGGFDRYPRAQSAAREIARGCAIAQLLASHDPQSSASLLDRWAGESPEAL